MPKANFQGRTVPFQGVCGSTWNCVFQSNRVNPVDQTKCLVRPGWSMGCKDSLLTTIWFAKFETCTWTTAYVKCRLGIFKKLIDPLVEWKISNELYVPGWQNWHWGGCFVPLNSHVNRGSQISHSKVTQSDSASCPKLLSPPLLDNSETLCRPFGEIGAAFVLRIQLAASHFMVPFITFAPNVALLPGKKRLGGRRGKLGMVEQSIHPAPKNARFLTSFRWDLKIRRKSRKRITPPTITP